MLMKYSQAEKRTRQNASSKQQRATGAMKVPVGGPTSRVGRKVMKRTALGHQRLHSARAEERTAVDPCDNSNDSGLGFDQHLELQSAARSTLRFADQEATWADEHSEVKRKKLEIKIESDDATDNFGFRETMSRRERRGEETHRMVSRSGGHMEHTQTSTAPMLRSPPSRQHSMGATRRSSAVPVLSHSSGVITSRNSKTQLHIICQPEQQHRARYQTEGSRGAVKDRSGNGFPVVKLTNYNKPATLEVFIGTDVGRVQPHMFYQACRVSGKNSTPCVEKKIEGTVVIEIEFDPAKDYVITCDCVGILKERNVDVEHRFPNEQQSRNKKKSTRCRMVFRTKITHPDGSDEWLQITSYPIVCTQPPGVPEICKKSLSSCPCTGGLELFILGKNFLKDTRVLFQQHEADTPWEESVLPDKEFLQQTHLVCQVPRYRRIDITEPVMVRLAILSSGKTSEPHTFTYTPSLQQPAMTPEGTQPCVTLVQSTVSHTGADVPHVFSRPPLVPPGAGLVLTDSGPTRTAKSSPKKNQYLSVEATTSDDSHRMVMWQTPSLLPAAETSKMDSKELDRVMSGKMMPPPPLLPISTRRASSSRLIVPDPDVPSLKTELTEDSSSQSPEDVKGIDLRMKPIATVNPMGSASDLLSARAPTMDTIKKFVTESGGEPLPTQSGPSIEKYLSNLEQVSDVTKAISERVVPPCKMADTMFTQQQSMMMYSAQTTTDCKPRFSTEDASLLQARRKSMYEEAMCMNTNPERRPLVQVSSLDQTVNSLIDNSPLLMYANNERRDEKMLSATQSQNVRLDAIVTQMQTAETEKLDALVNSAAASHMITSPASPIPVKKMPHSGPVGYDMMSTCNPLLTSSNPQLNIDTASRSSNIMFSGQERTSPVAMKTILNSPHEEQILVTSPTRTSPGASLLNDLHTTSSIAVKKMVNANILTSSDGSQIAVKTMMEPARTSPGATILSTVLASGTTSPIAVKKMEETSLVTSPINANILPSSDGNQMMSGVAPIAIKTMMETSGSPTRTSPGTNILNTLPHGQILVPCSTSPVALKKMEGSPNILNSSDASQMLTGVAPIAIKTMMESPCTLNRTSSITNMMEQANTLNRTSSIANMMEQANTLNRTSSIANMMEQANTLNRTSSIANMMEQANTLNRTSSIANMMEQANTLNRTSSIANMMEQTNTLNRTSSVSNMMEPSTSLSRTSSVTNMMNVLSHGQILGSGSTSPIALKKMEDDSLMSSPMNTNILTSDNSQMMTNPSPIAMKTMMETDTPSSANPCLANVPLTSGIAVKTMLNSESLMSDTSASVRLNTALAHSQQAAIMAQRSSALVQSQQAVPTENTRLQSTMSAHPQQDPVLISGAQTAALMESAMNSQPQTLEGNSALSALVQQQQTVSAENARLNALIQSNLSQQQQAVLATTAENMRLGALTQSNLNAHSQQTVVTSSAHLSSESARLNELVQSTLNSQAAATERLSSQNSILPQATQACMSVPTVTASDVLLNTIFATNQSPVVQAQYTTAPPSTEAMVDRQNSRFVTMLGLEAEKKNTQQKQEKLQAGTTAQQQQQPQKKGEEAMVPQDITQMSDNDLLCYINPNAFDQV